MKEPLSDVRDIQQRARTHIESGAVTDEYKADSAEVVRILNEILATELICMLRYKSHYYLASGIHSDAVKREFFQHSKEAQQHADLVAQRIVQLNGAPDFNPAGLSTRSRAGFDNPPTLTEMIKEDLIAERIAIETYSEFVRWLGDEDITTRKLMEDILTVESEHAEDMKHLLLRVAAATGKTRTQQHIGR
jgi:bacterioferritin